jgi:hypothetical protein
MELVGKNKVPEVFKANTPLLFDETQFYNDLINFVHASYFFN